MSVTLRARPADKAALPLRAAIRLPGCPAPAALSAAAVAGVLLFLLPLRGLDLGRMNALGLISALPVASLAGLALLMLAFVLALGLRSARPLLLGGILAAILICLHGVTSIIESQPRFATGYQIAGFTEYISRTGHTAPGIDAYFSWPGFFALVAFLKAVTGAQNLTLVLQWWPVVIDAAYLVPMGLILRNLRASWQAKWFAALLFTVGLWVGQDYFSPQAFNYLLYLMFIAIALTWFRGSPTAQRPGRPGGAPGPGPGGRPGSRTGGRLARISWRLAGRFQPGELPARPATNSERAVLLAVLIAIFVASTASHQLTPFLMLGAVGALVLARRTTLTGLPVLLLVILICWISFAATGYWSGHISDIFGGVGHLGGNISAGVGGRLAGATPAHEFVLYARVGFTALLIAMAGAGLARRRHRLIDDRAALALMIVPFLALGLQNYGGEIVLRVYMFALPAICVLAAYLFFPEPGPAGGADDGQATAQLQAAPVTSAVPAVPAVPAVRRGRLAGRAQPRRRPWLALAAAAACVIAMSGAFLIARYGNEAFEQTPTGELTAMNYIYAHDRGGVRVLWLSQTPPLDATPQMPWQYRDIEKVHYIAAQAPVNPAALSGLLAALRAEGPHSYLIATRTQDAYLQYVASYRPGWGHQFQARMSAAPGVRTVLANHDAVIYTLGRPAGPAAPRLNADAGGQPVRATIWTPVGLGVLALLLLVLGTREFIRVRGRSAVRYIRPLTWASLPLLVLMLGIVAERFVVLS